MITGTLQHTNCMHKAASRPTIVALKLTLNHKNALFTAISIFFTHIGTLSLFSSMIFHQERQPPLHEEHHLPTNSNLELEPIQVPGNLQPSLCRVRKYINCSLEELLDTHLCTHEDTSSSTAYAYAGRQNCTGISTNRVNVCLRIHTYSTYIEYISRHYI
jgi:hypothetical protein